MNYRSGMMLIGSKSGKKEANLEKKFKRLLGTGNALFSFFDQFSYFDHNLHISDLI